MSAMPLSSANDSRHSSSNTDIPVNPLALPCMRGLKIASLNINKLLTHLDELKIYLANNDIDILSINETKLSEFDSDNTVHDPRL